MIGFPLQHETVLFDGPLPEPDPGVEVPELGAQVGIRRVDPLRRLIARALRDAGYLREAVASYETAQRINPTDADLGAELGDLYARIGLGQRAIEQYRLVLQREPDHLGARRGLANVRAGAAGS